jgi:hypothetical protein
MKKLLMACAIALAFMPQPSIATTGYMIYWTRFQPYEKIPVTGPFPTYNDCARVMIGLPYRSGGSYSCDPMSY